MPDKNHEGIYRGGGELKRKNLVCFKCEQLKRELDEVYTLMNKYHNLMKELETYEPNELQFAEFIQNYRKLAEEQNAKGLGPSS